MLLWTKRWLLWPSLLLVFLLLGGGLFLWGRDGQGTKPNKGRFENLEARVPVTVGQVSRGEVDRRISLSGSLYPRAEVVLFPKISGRIKAIRADRGDRVESGQLLAKLDDRELTLSVEEARAAMEINQAQLAQLNAGTRPEEVAQAQARTRRHKAAYENARAQRVRMEGLFQQGIISQGQLDETRLQHDTALAELNTAQEALNLALQGPRKEDKEAAAAQVRKARAASQLAEARLRDASIVAPFKGILSKRQIEIGAMVSPTTPLFTLVQSDEVKARAGVTEREVSLVRIGMAAEIRVDGYPKATFPGQVTRISPVVDPASRTFEVEVSLDNRSGQLKPGMYARIDLLVRQRADVLRIPRDALVETDHGVQVFVHRKGRARILRVEKGLEDSDLVEVQGPALREGVEVILTGLKDLQDGTSVIVTNRDSK